MLLHSSLLFFFFNDTATTEIYTLSLHDALPISWACANSSQPTSSFKRFFILKSRDCRCHRCILTLCRKATQDRKSTRLNSSHANISYAVFCLKKKKLRNPILPSADFYRLADIAF